MLYCISKMNRSKSNIAVNSRTQRIIDLVKDKIDDSNISNHNDSIAAVNNMVPGNENIIIELVDEIVPSEDVLTLIPSEEHYLTYDTSSFVTNNISVNTNEVTLTQVGLPLVYQLTNMEVISDVPHQEKSTINKNILLPNICESAPPNYDSATNDDPSSYIDLDDSLSCKEQYISYNETSGPNDSNYVPSLLESSDEEPLEKRQCNPNNLSQHFHQENLRDNIAEEITDDNNTMTASIAKGSFSNLMLNCSPVTLTFFHSFVL